MAAKIICFVAFVCTANGSPMGQTTIYEASNMLPGLVPGLTGSTMCEPSPNLIYPYGLGAVVEPGILGLGYPYSIGVQAPAATTVIETNPPAVNLGYLGGLSGLGVPSMMGYGGIGGVGLGLGYPHSGLGLAGVPPVGGTTMCESSTPGVLGLGFGLPLSRPFL